MPASLDLGMWRKVAAVAHPWLPAYNITIWNVGIPNCYTKFKRLARLADSEVLVSASRTLCRKYCPSRQCVT